MVVQDFAKKDDDLKFKIGVMSIYDKNIQTLLLQNHRADLADILHEAYGALPHVK